MVEILGKDDPYRKMNTAEKDIRPGFLSNEKGDGSRGGAGDGRVNRDGAADDLRQMESGAEKNTPSQAEDSIAGARQNEESAGGFYRGGISKNKKKDGRLKGKSRGLLKRKGPLGLIIGLIFGIGGLSFFGISTELVAWKENIYSMFGQGSAVISRRSNYTMKKLLGGYRSVGDNEYRINSKLAQKLSAEGIEYAEVSDTNGKKLGMLLYEDADGNYTPIVASDSDVSRAKAMAGMEVEIEGGKVTLADNGLTLSEARRTNPDFSNSYDTATITFTGKIAGWFDNVVDSLFNRIIGRNARNQTSIDDPDEESVDKLLLGNASDGVENDEVKAIKEEAELDDDGKPTGKYKYEDIKNGDTEVDLGDGSSVTLKDIENENGRILTDTDTPNVDAVRSSLSARARKAAMTASSVGCAILRGVGAISVAIGAVQTMNVIQYASKYLEMADRIKAGKADETVNIAMSNLNEYKSVNLYDIDGKPVKVEGAVTDGDGWNTVFASSNMIDESDPSALIMNRELANKNAIRGAINNAFGSGSSAITEIISSVGGAVGGFAGGVMAFRICNSLQMAAGIVSVFADLGSVFTLGFSKAIKDIIVGAVKGAKIAAAMGTIALILNAITPTIAQWFTSQLGNIFLGKTGGYALYSGAQNIMNSNLQMSTGKYADKENAIELFALTRDVEKEWAAYERSTKSPFDVTSKYTFLGSIYNSILPVLNTSGGTAVSMASSMAGLAKDSTIALISPSASAASEVNDFTASLSSEGNCGYLDSVGVAGDFACNKYTGAYIDEIETMDSGTVYQNMVGYDSFDGEDSDGNPKVKADSDYAKYIVACVSSDSQPGTMNGAVQGFLTGINKDIYDSSTVASGLVNFGRNFIPFEGFLDIAEAGEEEKNMKWNSGWACTGKTNDSAFNEKIKNFSMYNLDQRVLYDMGVIENNSTVSFLEDYYEENPLDQSFEGKIARFSGLSKEEVEDTLALIDYYNYIADYDATTRYAFGAPVVEKPEEILFDNENTVAQESSTILLNEITFADVRNRSFAI